MAVRNGKYAPCILVIDDDPEMQAMLGQMLESEGYKTIIADNGKIGTNLEEKIPFDLVITDILMPEQDGLETIKIIRQKSPYLKIIAISGGGTVGLCNCLSWAEEIGANRILAKPFKRKIMLETINDLLVEEY